MSHNSDRTEQSFVPGTDSQVPFDWVLRSALQIPPRSQWRFKSFAEMLFEEDPKLDARKLLIGADHHGPLELALADLRSTARKAATWCAEQEYSQGDSLLLARLPHSSEVPLAAAAIALMSIGFRVVMPMSFDRHSLADMARQSDCRAMLWCADLAEHTSNEQVQRADAMFRAVASEVGIPTFSLDSELNWHLSAESEPCPSTSPLAETKVAEREVLVLSTSGSTGQPKLARYTDFALLKVAEAWQAAGLMSESLTGGRSLCPAVSHSMGFRNVLHAVWNRQPTLLAQTEWLEEKPKQYVKLLERCPPQHITCGPAYLGDLGLLASSIERVRKALSSLQVVVSSGASAVEIQRKLPSGIRIANAFGMTELQQVLNTLLTSASSVRGALGRPLPEVAVAVHYLKPTEKVGRLFISAPFASRGYLGQPNFGEWFETGDLVRVEGEDLIWVGRRDDDFLNTGHGVKVSLAELRGHYHHLQNLAEAVVFTSLPSRGGLGAIVYLGRAQPQDTQVHDSILTAIETDHRLMADRNRDFALEYMSLSAVGCVAGRPPKRGPGKVDGEEALRQQAELLAVLDDPLADHPWVINVPPFGSDRPDWRRFAADKR